MTGSKKIAFKVELSRILELLADQIYQSPLALLRENTQNAFDAIRMRLHIGQDFEPEISIEIADDQIIVSDNGIGMTPTEIEENFWYAARAARTTTRRAPPGSSEHLASVRWRTSESLTTSQWRASLHGPVSGSDDLFEAVR